MVLALVAVAALAQRAAAVNGSAFSLSAAEAADPGQSCRAWLAHETGQNRTNTTNIRVSLPEDICQSCAKAIGCPIGANKFTGAIEFSPKTDALECHSIVGPSIEDYDYGVFHLSSSESTSSSGWGSIVRTNAEGHVQVKYCTETLTTSSVVSVTVVPLVLFFVAALWPICRISRFCPFHKCVVWCEEAQESRELHRVKLMDRASDQCDVTTAPEQQQMPAKGVSKVKADCLTAPTMAARGHLKALPSYSLAGYTAAERALITNELAEGRVLHARAL